MCFNQTANMAIVMNSYKFSYLCVGVDVFLLLVSFSQAISNRHVCSKETNDKRLKVLDSRERRGRCHDPAYTF